ncbi:hypothetical protein IQ230_21625 [Gloeocapsopsis crepidinum LEGE 06123]|uniref:Uncharacterized protein n=1 Tax=Gloeocapsopsis crepidinum LEGE 06123 TaxID=588587 RepID=A0ABR9UX97_9CHRO|nr:hypothetical protein [Gloeocapsopsis crepidinum]MBE9192906.1 hypothetical protein [Gloeocapsopsis crepidinum LEGE 06123]
MKLSSTSLATRVNSVVRLIPKLVFASTTIISLAVFDTNPAVAQTNEIIYSGVATTTIQYPDVYGTSFHQQTIQTPVQCVVSAQQSDGSSTESNPFNLQIGFVDPSVGTSVGAISMWSAAVATTSTGSLLVQYWNYQLNGNQFSGQLVNNATSLATAFNLVNFPLIIPPNLNLGGYPYAMANGTQIIGVFSQDINRLNVQISGQTVDLARSFVSEIVCTR